MKGKLNLDSWVYISFSSVTSGVQHVQLQLACDFTANNFTNSLDLSFHRITHYKRQPSFLHDK
jgi:hypothetical protein